MQGTAENKARGFEGAERLEGPARLGSSETTRKQGRWARLMGSWWRHPKRECIGHAAAGVFMDILSYCADQGVDRISPKTFRQKLMAGDRNGARLLRELVEAQLLDVLEDGSYQPHDWYEHNNVPKPKLRLVSEEPEPTNVKRNVKRNVKQDVKQPEPEIIQETPVSRARASTQDPGIKKPSPTEPVETPPRKPRPRDERQRAFLAVLERLGRELAFLPRGLLTGRHLGAVVGRVGDLAQREGISFDAAAERLVRGAHTDFREGRKRDLKWALVDWQPGAPSRPQGSPRRVEPAPCGNHVYNPDTTRRQLRALGMTDEEIDRALPRAVG